MAMVDIDGNSLLVDSSAKSVGLVWQLATWRPSGASLHSPNEPGELSQWPRYDDSSINISVSIIY